MCIKHISYKMHEVGFQFSPISFKSTVIGYMRSVKRWNVWISEDKRYYMMPHIYNPCIRWVGIDLDNMPRDMQRAVAIRELKLSCNRGASIVPD